MKFARRSSTPHAGVARHVPAEAFPVEGHVPRRHPADEVRLELRQLRFAPHAQPRRRLRLHLGRIVGLRPRPLEHEEVVDGEVHRVEAERRAAVADGEFEVGARPVRDRHEIGADRGDPRRRHRAHAVLVGAEIRPPLGGTQFDLLVDRDALHHAPLQPGRLDERLPLHDHLARPHLAGRHLVQRRDDAHRAGLAHVGKRNRVGRPEPAPGLQHGMSFLPSRADTPRGSRTV